MATVRLSLNPGDRLQDVVQATGVATVTKGIELTIDTPTFTSNTTGKEQAILAARMFVDWLIQSTWPLQ